MVINLPPGSTLVNGFAFGKDLDMFGYCLAGHVEVFGDGVGGHGLCRQQDQDTPAGRVGNGLENVAWHIVLCNWLVANICNFPVAQNFFLDFFDAAVASPTASQKSSSCSEQA